jgi:hypothetical protein
MCGSVASSSSFPCVFTFYVYVCDDGKAISHYDCSKKNNNEPSEGGGLTSKSDNKK